MAKSEKTIGSFSALYLALLTALRIIKNTKIAIPEKIARCTIKVNPRKMIVTSDACNTDVRSVGNCGGFGLIQRSGKNEKNMVTNNVKKKDSIIIF